MTAFLGIFKIYLTEIAKNESFERFMQVVQGKVVKCFTNKHLTCQEHFFQKV